MQTLTRKYSDRANKLGTKAYRLCQAGLIFGTMEIGKLGMDCVQSLHRGNHDLFAAGVAYGTLVFGAGGAAALYCWDFARARSTLNLLRKDAENRTPAFRELFRHSYGGSGFWKDMAVIHFEQVKALVERRKVEFMRRKTETYVLAE